MPVIGFLSIRSPGTDAQFLVSFRQGLSDSGFVEGQNIAVEYRYAEGQIDRLPSLVADLVRRQVAIIVTTGSVQGALTAKTATNTIPIVFTTGGDPLREGLVHSLNRPGGNLTGVTTSFSEAAPVVNSLSTLFRQRCKLTAIERHAKAFEFPIFT